MKTVALLIYAESSEALLAECHRQIDLIPKEEYSFGIFVNPNLDEAWREAGQCDFYLWLHGGVIPAEGAFYRMLDNSSFLGNRALLVGTVRDARGRIVSGGFGRNRRLIAPDPVIPVACRLFDGLFALVPAEIYRKIGLLGGRYRGQLAGFDYSIRGHKAGYPTVIAPGTMCSCRVRTDPDRTLRSEFMLDLRNKGPFVAIGYFFRAWLRRIIIRKVAAYE